MKSKPFWDNNVGIFFQIGYDYALNYEMLLKVQLKNRLTYSVPSNTVKTTADLTKDPRR